LLASDLHRAVFINTHISFFFLVQCAYSQIENFCVVCLTTKRKVLLYLKTGRSMLFKNILLNPKRCCLFDSVDIFCQIQKFSKFLKLQRLLLLRIVIMELRNDSSLQRSARILHTHIVVEVESKAHKPKIRSEF
jgi:hypothetical protein